MRAVLQRVTGACVHVDGKLVSAIGPGIVALIGIATDDTAEEIAPLCNKILSLKMWNEGQKAWAITTPSHYPVSETRAQPPSSENDGKSAKSNDTSEVHASRKEEVWGGKPWKTSVVDLEGEVLCISQFTLHGRTVKGTKPDFHRAMGGAQARQLYDELLRKLGDGYRSERVKDGAFGEMMQVSLSNDGPVTLTIDTADKRH